MRYLILGLFLFGMSTQASANLNDQLFEAMEKSCMYGGFSTVLSMNERGLLDEKQSIEERKKVIETCKELIKSLKEGS